VPAETFSAGQHLSAAGFRAPARGANQNIKASGDLNVLTRLALARGADVVHPVRRPQQQQAVFRARH
jgi:hypothetical protein